MKSISKTSFATAMALLLSMCLLTVVEDAFAGETDASGQGGTALIAAQTDGSASVSANMVTAASTIASGKCGSSLNWTLDSDYKLSITGSGAMYDYSYNTTPWYSYKDQVKSISIANGVTTIGDYAFYYMTGLASAVTVPASVYSIGDAAFYLYKPTSITLNEGLLQMGSRAFAESGLTSVTLPSTLNSIGDDAFRYQNWYSSTKNPLKSVTIKNGPGSIGEYAFFGCNALTSVTIPASVYQIGPNAFAYCTALANVKLNEGLVTIDQNAFNACTKLTSITLPQSLSTIGNSAFASSGLTAVTVPKKCYSIGDYAFHSCGSLATANLGTAGIGTQAFASCAALKSVTIGGEVGEQAFFNCSSLEQISFENDGSGGTLGIGKSAFKNCTQLKSVTMPITLSYYGLESGAFAGCTALQTAYFPNTVSSSVNIPDDCFSGDVVTVVYPSEEIRSSNPLNDPWETIRMQSREGIVAWQPSEALYSGECGGGVSWSFDNVGTLVISGTGAMDDYESADEQPWSSVRNQITSVVIKDGVTSIGDWSLANCPLRIFSIGNSITRIGDSAMRAASALRLSIPGTVKTIGDDAFSQIDNLLSVTVGEGVRELSAYAFANCPELYRVNLPDSLQTIGKGAFLACIDLLNISIPDAVKEIGPEAFESCISLSELQMPASAKTIGESAFGHCSSLKSIVFLGSAPEIGSDCFKDDTLNAYYSSVDTSWTPSVMQHYGGNVTWKANDVILEGQCGNNLTFTLDNLGNLVIKGSGPMYDFIAYDGDGHTESLPWAYYQATVRTVSLPDGLTTIGANAFCEFSKLKNVTLPASLTSIGEAAFEGCSSLQEVAVPSQVSMIGERAFNRCTKLAKVTLPNNINQIADALFCRCESLRTVVIPDGVTRIGGNAFEYCDLLVSVSIPESVTEIGMFAFGQCYSLREIIVPDGVSSIGMYAFYFCTNLERAVIGEGLTTLEEATLYGCTALKEIELPSTLTTIGPWSVNRCPSLESLTIPDGVTTIDQGAFCFDTALKTVNIPLGVTAIPESLFYGCTSLESIDLPEGVNSIGARAFEGCSSLEAVTFWEPVRTIGARAFAECSGLGAIKFTGDIPAIADDSFANVTHATLYYALENPTWSTLDTSTMYHYGGKMGLAGTGIKDYGPIAFGPHWDFTTDGTLYIRGMDAIPSPDADAGVQVPWYLHNDQITSIVIEDGATSIGAGAFKECTALENITVPESVTSLGDDCIPAAATIYCVTGSMADSYAARNGNPAIKHTHEWDKPVWTWESDTQVSAQFTCQIDPNHVKVLPAIVSETILKEASYLEEGSKVCVAAIALDGESYTDVQTRAIPKLASLPNEITGNRSYSKAYAKKAQSFKLNAKALGGKLSYKSSSKYVTVTADGSVTVKAKAPVGAYTITVAASDSTGRFQDVSLAVALTVTPTKTAVASAKNSAAGKATVKWKKNATGSGYQIQYDTAKSFKSAKTLTIKKKAKKKAVISKLKKGKTYYVRIRTMKKVSGKTYYSDWSAKKKVKIRK